MNTFKQGHAHWRKLGLSGPRQEHAELQETGKTGMLGLYCLTMMVGLDHCRMVAAMMVWLVA